MQDYLHLIPTSPTLGMNQKAKSMIASGKAVYRLGFGESPFDPPKEVVRALQAHADLSFYGQVHGEASLRQAVSRFHKDAFGIESSAEDVIIAPGSKMLLFVIMASFTHADVLIPRPAWVSYGPQAQLCGHNAIKVSCSYEERWRVRPEAIEKAIQEKVHKQSILIINHPGNPDGANYSEEELEAIAIVCRKHDILFISDEIYALLSHSAPHVAMANIYPEGTITTTGLSKWCGAGGWRLGVALLPPDIPSQFKKTLIGVCSETYSCTSQPIQAAACAAYENYEQMRPYLEQQQHILRQLADWIYKALNTSEIRVHPSVGGFYFFPDFSAYADRLSQRGINTSTEFCTSLLEDTGVALLPGEAFGCDPDQFNARLAYVDFSPPEDLNDFVLDLHAEHLQEGISRMLDWLKGL